MKNIRSCLLAGLVFAATAVSAVQASVQSPSTQSGDKANGKRSAAVVFSSRYKNLGLERAYQLQKAYVRNQLTHGVRVVGFKAGLTMKGVAEHFGLSEPITGVLIEDALHDNAKLDLDNAYNLNIEPEIAFRVAKKIDKSVKLKSVKSYFDAVAPAVELPDLSFTSDKFNGVDIIANNALAYRFIVGDWQDLSVVTDLNSIKTTVYCNDKPVTEGEARMVHGGQWRALTWMVNQLLEQGYTLQKGQILITGSMAKRVAATACQYRAEFGQLGRINFTVTD